MAHFCVDDTGRCFPRDNGNQFPTPLSVKTPPDIAASNGGSQEEKRVEEDFKIKRKRTSVKGDVQARPPRKLAKRWERCILQSMGESPQTEITSGINTVKELQGDDQVREQEFPKENEVDKEFSALWEEEDRVTEMKDRLVQYYDDQFSGIIQLVQDQRENLLSRLTDVRHYSPKLTPETKEVETRLKTAKDKYHTIIKAEKEKRWKTEAELQSEKSRYSKLDADLKYEKVKCARLETEVEFEMSMSKSCFEKWMAASTRCGELESDFKSEEAKRLKLEEDVRSEKERRMKTEAESKSHEAERVKVQADMQLERGKRLKLEEAVQSEEEKRLKLEEDLRLSEQKMESERSKLVCQICLQAIRDTMILPCTHFLYCNGCLVQHKTRSNTCPTCRGSMTALLHCYLGVS